jgi:hypothetical protein
LSVLEKLLKVLKTTILNSPFVPAMLLKNKCLLRKGPREAQYSKSRLETMVPACSHRDCGPGLLAYRQTAQLDGAENGRC